MPSVLICAPNSVAEELSQTILWRDDIERRVTDQASEAIGMMISTKPDLIVVDARIGDAERFLSAVRQNPVTRPVSIVIVARDDVAPGAVLRFIESGANAILRFPIGPEWDDRLSTLLYVPQRKVARLAALVQFEATGDVIVTTVAGTVLNISENGILVETDVPLPLGTDIDFKIHLRDKPQPIIGCGQIVRQETPRRSGVRFYGLEADGLERIRRFVNG